MAKENAAPAKEKPAKPEYTAKELIEQLKTETDQAAKRNIRAKLRKLGHTGGIPKDQRPSRAKEKPATADKPKGSRAAK